MHFKKFSIYTETERATVYDWLISQWVNDRAHPRDMMDDDEKGAGGKGMYDIVYIGEKHCLRILFVSCNTIRLGKIIRNSVCSHSNVYRNRIENNDTSFFQQKRKFSENLN